MRKEYLYDTKVKPQSQNKRKNEEKNVFVSRSGLQIAVVPGTSDASSSIKCYVFQYES